MQMIKLQGRLLSINRSVEYMHPALPAQTGNTIAEIEISENALAEILCLHCKHKRKPGMKQFEGFMARLFIDMVKLSKDARMKGIEYRGLVRSEDIREQIGATRYARIGDLKYWGLIRQEKEWWHYGIYQLTDLAYLFMKGARIAQKVYVAKGITIQKSPETISLQEALGKQWNTIAGWIGDWRNRYIGGNEQMNLL